MRPIPVRKDIPMLIGMILLGMWLVHPRHLIGAYRPMDSRSWNTHYFWAEKTKVDKP